MKNRVLVTFLSICVMAGIMPYSANGISVNAAQKVYGVAEAERGISVNASAGQELYDNAKTAQEETEIAAEDPKKDISLLAEKSEVQEEEKNVALLAEKSEVLEEDWDWNENDDGSVSISGYYGSDLEVDVPSMLGGKKVTEISDGAFQYKEEMLHITIPGTVKKIGGDAFSWCGSLQSIFLPEGLESIGDNAFSSCAGLQSIVLPKSLKSIGDGAFSNCSGLKDIAIPAQVERIGTWTFSNCTALNDVMLPESLASIGKGAFEKSGIKGIQIPKNVSEIAIQAFSSCDNLEKIEVAPENRAFLSEDGILFNKEKTELLAYPEGKKQENYAVPSGVRKIGPYAFAYQNNNALSKVTLPDSIEEIGAYAFYYAFFDSMNFSERLKSVGEFAFAYNGFKKVQIPANTQEIGIGAFVYAPDLESFEVDASNASFASEEGLLLDKKKTALIAYPGGRKAEEYIIPAGITDIGPYAFTTHYGNPYPQKILLPKSVERVKTDALSGMHIQDITVINPECAIEWAMDEDGYGKGAISSRATIHGYENSTAQEYAEKNGNTFVILSDEVCQHDYTERVKVAATCGKKGVKAFACKKCGDSYTEEIPMLTHDYQKVTVKATTSKDGNIQKKCKFCGDVTEAVSIAHPKTIALSKSSVTYHGRAQKVSVKVKDRAGKAVASANYSVSYRGNRNVGEATVTIKFKGNYTGSVKRTFRILPKGTSLSKISAKSKGLLAKWKKQAAQTDGYQIQYSTNSKFKSKDTKTVSIKKNKITSKSLSKLKAKKKYYVRIRTYKAVKIKGKNVTLCSAWSKAKAIKTKK